MAADALFDIDIFPGELSDEEIDRFSAEITDGYNTAAEPDLSIFEPGETYESGQSNMPAQHKDPAGNRRNYPGLIAICVCLVVGCLSVCMLMMQKSVDAQEHLDDMKATLQSYREDAQRIDTEIRRVCEMDAVAAYADSMGLHKASQYQIVYVGGNSRQGGIVSNAGDIDYGETDVWERLKSFFD